MFIVRIEIKRNSQFRIEITIHRYYYLQDIPFITPKISNHNYEL